MAAIFLDLNVLNRGGNSSLSMISVPNKVRPYNTQGSIVGGLGLD